MELQEFTIQPAIRVQETVLRNVQEDCKLNEERAQQDHQRFITNRIAYLHILQCNPFIA
jgi:hypothetical protein